MGLLDEIRAATYRRARRLQRGQAAPVLWALDEVANIAPLKALPAVVSEGGGQGLQVMACFQDLSQARWRWGTAADGFLSLFTNKLVFAGIGDVATLQALSLLAGTHEHPRTTVTRTWGRTRTYDTLIPSTSATRGGSVSVSTHREAILTEGRHRQHPGRNSAAAPHRRWSS